MSYAKKLTKEDLIRDGINDIKNGVVIRNGYEIKLQRNNHGYLCFAIYDYDADGNRIKLPKRRKFTYKTSNGFKQTKEVETYVYKCRMVGLHRATWAWEHGEVPEGYVVDHKNNRHDCLEDYDISNLQLLTPKANLAKERKESTREIRCKMNKPREFYESLVKKYDALYTKAKLEKDSKKCHLYRTDLANSKARLRYWESHKDEYKDYIIEKEVSEQMLKDKRDLSILQNYKREFKLAGNKQMWHQCCKVEKLWKSGELNQAAKEHVIEVLLKFGVR